MFDGNPVGLGLPDFFLSVALKVEQGCEVAVVDLGRCCSRNDRFRVQGDAETCFADHAEVICAVANRHGLGGWEAILF